MDNLTEIKATADTAEAEVQKNSAAAELGKFKDVQALIDAYNSLEAEFTRRSQRLKQLEASKAQEASAQTENAQTPSPERKDFSGDDFVRAARESAAVKDAVIGDYLKSVAENKGVAFLVGGSAVSAARNKPASISEAGELAKKFLK